MPTNRPFLANFLAAFRAHSALTAKTSTSPPSVTTASPTTQFTLPSTSTAARTITTSTSPQPTPSQSQNPPTSSPPNPSQLKASTASPPISSSTAALSAATGPLSHRARHPSASPPPRSPTQTPFTRVPQRRGSDSSSDGGFREVLGGEKWYIGGRTAAGEERFYKMGIVRRERSWERNSFDRLSL